MSTVWVRVVYGVVLAMLLALTVIFGIAMAIPGPKPAQIPEITAQRLFSSNNQDESRSQNQLRNEISKFYDDATAYREKLPAHHRNVFLAAAGFGVLWVLIGVGLPAVTNYLRLGFTLGGALLFIFAYQTITSDIPKPPIEGEPPLALLTAGEPAPLNLASNFAMFAVSFIGLILSLFLGLWRLTEWSSGDRNRRPASGRPRGTAPASASPPSAAPSSSQWAPAPAIVATTPAPAPASETPNQWAPASPPAAESAPAPAPASASPQTDGEGGPTAEWKRPNNT